MNRLLLFLVVVMTMTWTLLFSSATRAQSLSEQWRTNLPVGAIDPWETLAADTEGNLYWSSLAPGTTHILVFKYRSNGEKLWETDIPLDTAVDVFFEVVRRLLVDSQGNVYLLVDISSKATPGQPNGYRKASIIKLSPTGTLQWMKSFNFKDQNIEVNGWGWDMGIDSAGNLYVMGVLDTSLAGGHNAYMFVFKCNPSGTALWYKQLPELDNVTSYNYWYGHFYWTYKLKVTPQGSVVASSKENGTTKLDTNGNIKWHKFPFVKYLSNLDENGNGVYIHEDLGLIQNAFDSVGDVYIIGTYYASGLTRSFVRTTKYSGATGEMLWEKDCAVPTLTVGACDIKVDRFDNVLCLVDVGTRLTNNPLPSNENRVIKYDKNGTLWEFKRIDWTNNEVKPRLLAVDMTGNTYFPNRDTNGDLTTTLVKISPTGAQLDARNVGIASPFSPCESLITFNDQVILTSMIANQYFLIKFGPPGSIGDLAFGPDGLTRLLWKSTNGIRLDKVTSTGVIQNKKYFSPPVVAGITFTAESIAVGKDYKTYLLWRGSDQRAVLQRLSADLSTIETAASYGPYLGWIPFDLSIPNGTASDGKPRLAWRRTTEANRLSLWRLTTNLAQDTSLESAPPANSTPIGLALTPNNQSHVFWKTNGSLSTTKNSYYRLDANSSLINSMTYGPFTTHIATDIAAGGSKNKARLLWQNTVSGQVKAGISLLSVDGSSIERSSSFLPPVTGAVPIKLSTTGVSERTQILWRWLDGKVTVQTIDPNTGANLGNFIVEP